MRSIRAHAERHAIALACTFVLATIAMAPGCREPLAAPLAPSHANDATPRQGGTLRLAALGDVRSLDPATSSDGLSPHLDELIFAGLLDYDERGQVVADLAERWDVSDDGRELHFILRQNVHFQDGEELTADDVKRSMERALHPSTPNAYASFFASIAGYADYAAEKAPGLAGVVVVGRYEVVIRLSRPDATFPGALAMHIVRPVCKSGGTRYADNWTPCGAGPFMLREGGWEHGQSLTLVRHPGYFRPGLPHVDAVRFLFNVEPTNQRFKLENGELDMVRDLTQPDMVRFQDDARWASSRALAPFNQVWGEAMNVEVPPFDNVEVRRAVAAAIHRERWAALKPGVFRATGRLLPPTVDPDRAGMPEQTYNLTEAREHMRRAGLPDGYAKRIPYFINKQTIGELTSQFLVQDLEAIGLHLDIHTMSYPTFLAVTRRRGKVAISSQGWQQDFPDASDFFEPLFTRAAINDDDSNNTSFFTDDTLEALVARGRGERSPEKRHAIYDEAERIVVDRAPWAFAYDVGGLTVWQPYVRGMRMHALWIYPLRDVWLDRDGGETGGRSARFEDPIVGPNSAFALAARTRETQRDRKSLP